MERPPEYLLAILPPPFIIELIATWKKSLEKEVGWFNSVNSDAHITVSNFDIDKANLQTMLRKIHSFCANAVPTEIHFNHFNSFQPHTFYIAPDKKTEMYLNRLIIHFHNAIYDKAAKSKAHMTIARRLDLIRPDTPKLDKSRLDYALDMFKNTEVDLSFTNNSLILRKFDGKQYNIFVEKFEFNGNPPLTLF